MIEEQIKIFIRDHFLLDEEEDVKVDLYSLDNNLSLIEDLSCDSLDIADIVAKCEDEWNIEFSEDDLGKLKTVGDLVIIAEKLISKK